MYINSIKLENIRTFAADKTVVFNHPDRKYGENEEVSNAPRLKNVNLLFGENASGKTTLLEAIALAALGPAINDSRARPRPLVRFVPKSRKPSGRELSGTGTIEANWTLHDQELFAPDGRLQKSEVITQLLVKTESEELESISHMGDSIINWQRVYSSDNASFFVVAYGAARRSDPYLDKLFGKDYRSPFVRLSRIESVLQESYPLVSLDAWFPARRSRTRNDQIIELVNSTLGRNHFKFQGKRKNGDLVFFQGGMEIPIRSLSDGYRAFLAWVGDLLFHLDYACDESRLELNEVRGIVMVDELDLHLHPTWQMQVVANLAKTFPRLQFIFTSHSPLIAGSVEWMNITRLRLDSQHRTGVDPFEQPIHGLDADQILVSELFGLKSTRAESKNKELQELTRLARTGDDDAAKKLIAALAQGSEGEL